MKFTTHQTRGNTAVWAIVIILAVLVVGYIVWSRTDRGQVDENIPTNNSGDDNNTDTAEPISVPLTDQGATVGMVTLGESAGKTKVVISLSGSDAGDRPAHIHLGSCPTVGAVEYPLQNVQNGSSTTELSVSMTDLLDMLPLAVNVHKSAAEANVYIGCANIPAADTSGNDGNMDTGDDFEGTNDAARVVPISGRNFAFSGEEIKVKKGEKINIAFSSEESIHDFVIDELNVRTNRVNTGDKDEITFTADKTGTFTYYCSVGNHRALGMTGKLIVE